MTKRFRKILSILCTLALLVSCATAVLAEELPEEADVNLELNGTDREIDAPAPEETEKEFPEELHGGEEKSTEPAEANSAEEEEEQPAPSKPENGEVISDPVTIQDEVEEKPEEQEEDKPAEEEKPAKEEKPAEEEPAEEEKPAQEEEPAKEEKPAAAEETEEKQETAVDKKEKKPADKPESKPEEKPEEPEEDLPFMDLDTNKTANGILTREKPFAFIAADAYSRTVVFTLTVPEKNAVSVTMNEKPVTLTKEENLNPASTDVIYTFEKQLLQNQAYAITLTAERDGYVPFSLALTEKQEAAAAETPETPEETTEEEEKTEETDSGLEEEETAAKEEKNELPENRNAVITISWDDENPGYGSVAHFHAQLTGYEGTEYTLQWQWSKDGNAWNDIENATGENMDITYSPENGDYSWRIVVDIIPTA